MYYTYYCSCIEIIQNGKLNMIPAQLNRPITNGSGNLNWPTITVNALLVLLVPALGFTMDKQIGNYA
jgi:hypothetical protein